MLQISLGQDPDTSTYIDAKSGGNIAHMSSSKGKQEYSTAVRYLG